jgi:membrane protein HdeD
MQKMGTALSLIILGLIVIAFPLLGVIPVALLSGFLILMVGIGLILAGTSEMGEGVTLGIPLLILGFFTLILGIGFIFNPTLFAWLVGFFVWIIGLILIITGIVRILSKSGDNRCGFKDIIFGILILLVGLLLTSYPWLLGVLIGLWLITTGLRIYHNPRFMSNLSGQIIVP